MIEQTAEPRSGILTSNASPAEAALDQDAIADAQDVMVRELSSWGRWQIGLGIVHLIGSGMLDGSWGIMLILVGLSSFWFRSPAMFVVYATTLVWAAVSNLSSGTTGWLGFGLLQLYFAYRIVRQFRLFTRVHRAAVGIGAPDRARRIFPIAATVLGVFALCGVIASFIDLAGTAGTPISQSTEMLIGLIINTGVLGLALALGSLFCGYRPRSLTLLGLITSGLAMLIWAITLLAG